MIRKHCTTWAADDRRCAQCELSGALYMDAAAGAKHEKSLTSLHSDGKFSGLEHYLMKLTADFPVVRDLYVSLKIYIVVRSVGL